MMTRAYDITYLEDGMSNIGAMLDYAVNSCGEDLSLFYTRFLYSGIARAISQANPKYISGLSGIELATQVANRTGDSLPDKDGFIDIGSQEYWTGWTMAYLSWYLNMDFGTLESRGVTILALHERYSTLHEADLSKAVQFAYKRIQESSQNLLKLARKNAGLTQRELAEKSGIPLRVIRSYEQGQRSIEKAEAESVWRLCQALHRKFEDLYPLRLTP